MNKTTWRWFFGVSGVPVAKPRQTQSDRWKQRAPVVKYRAFADDVRLAARLAEWKEEERGHYTLTVEFFLPFPKSTSARRREELAGTPHTVKPDASNLLKAVEDALFIHDQAIWSVSASKRYDDGNGPRTEITIEWER
jgi:Holliday junction resolvase RusA-like endonuclease